MEVRRLFKLAGYVPVFSLLLTCSYGQAERIDTGLAPEVTDLNAKDVSYTLEHKLPYLEEPFVTTRPEKKNDGIPVGELGVDGGNKERILRFAESLAQPAPDERSGRVDSFLIYHRGKLLFESYYRRGRANYPHYQMSITKAYTGLALGRAIALGHLSMDDLDRPVVSFLNDLDRSSLVEGASSITLHEALHMSSGVRLDPEKAKELRRDREKLKGQGQIQAYLEYSEPIPLPPRKMKYQPADPAMVMQVLEAKVPGPAEDFIRDELFAPLGIMQYHWERDLSGLPKSAAGSSFLSRDMLKIGILVLNRGRWQGEQHIPEEFIQRATSKLVHSYGNSHYGYFWWVEDFPINGKTFTAIEGRGAGGQFIFIFPELDLIAVVTSHNKGMGKMLQSLPNELIPAFTR
jgi:CubicO group peptidase (beta-lactamase class C family)